MRLVAFHSRDRVAPLVAQMYALRRGMPPRCYCSVVTHPGHEQAGVRNRLFFLICCADVEYDDLKERVCMYLSGLSNHGESCASCGQQLQGVVSHSVIRQRASDEVHETDSPDLGDFKHTLRRFIQKHGPVASALLQRARELWYGSTSDRAALVGECNRNLGLLEAWDLVNMAGQEGARYLPLLARRVILGPFIDLRA